MSSSNTYTIHPSFEKRIQSSAVRECIQVILSDHLGDKDYSRSDVSSWTRIISEKVRNKIKELGEDKRYKTVVQVIIGEMRGEGVKIGSRCLWDADTDNCFTESFRNDTLFCVVAVFVSYYY
ncbi:tctex1 domain-containing protein 2-like [Centruroides sculpturatus]|uniref:tctex1 domain-containing protein 2-like n=1 Tax=Centruroides sculpturatus TaxID=218467 RepID=UPI000C6E0096|nr:tctex1 domain-containing protein 2-like [Centruroides sculpturatus]